MNEAQPTAARTSANAREFPCGSRARAEAVRAALRASGDLRALADAIAPTRLRVPADAWMPAARQPVADLASSALTYWDRALRCRYANPACRDWFGVERERIVGSELADLFWPALAPLLPHAVAALDGPARSVLQAFDAPGGPRRAVVYLRPDGTVCGAGGLLIEFCEAPL